MKPIDLARLRRASLFALALGGALATACTGGNLGLVPPAASNLSRSVRIVYRIHQPAPSGYIQLLDPARRANEEAVGTRFLPDKVVSGPIPATGHYARIGDQMIQVGLDGIVQIPAGLNVPAQVGMFAQLSDTQPMAFATLSGALRPATEAPATVDVQVDCKPFPDADGMDFGSTTGRSVGTKNCCARTGTRLELSCERKVYTALQLATNDPAVSACDDFDDKALGRVGAKALCAPQRFVEFVNTPCYQWTFGTDGKSSACIDERAILDIDGAGCFNNHKYRFCQNMSPKDFDVSALGSTTIGVSGSVKIRIRNNTPANETQFSDSKQTEGTLVGPVLSGQIKHYDDEKKAHLTEVECEWLAPRKLPAGISEATETLTFRANGLEKTVTIKIVQNCTDSRGRLVPCK